VETGVQNSVSNRGHILSPLELLSSCRVHVQLIVGRPSPHQTQILAKQPEFKIGSWVQIKQEYLTILCFFFPFVQGLSSQYFNIFPRELSEGNLSWAFVCWPPSLLPLFPISLFWLTVEVSCTMILYHFVHLCLHPLWELEAPLGSQWVSINS
jgi:hypothetical protein